MTNAPDRGAAAPVYRLRHVIKERRSDAVGFRLIVPELTIHAGEQVALVGESGSGKSTLLDMLAMVLQPDAAECFELGAIEQTIDIAAIWSQHNQDRLGALRKAHVGYVLQTGGLLPFLTVRDNIGLSRRILQLADDGAVKQLAGELGIARQLDKLPGELSAGQRQRAAIARALAHRPRLVIADEPTAALDPVTAKKVMALFVGLVNDMGITLIVASHDWPQIEALGLRQLAHGSHFNAAQNLSESRFADDGSLA